MRAQIFNLTYQPSLGGFDDDALQTLLRDKEPTSFQAQFFAVPTVHGDPWPSLCCVIVWNERESPGLPGATAAAGKRAAARERTKQLSQPRQPTQQRERVELELSADQRRVFEALRLWRRARANELSVPAFRVLTDRQLASVVRLRPLDTQALAALDGVGASRAQRCGDSLFGALRAATNASAAA